MLSVRKIETSVIEDLSYRWSELYYTYRVGKFWTRCIAWQMIIDSCYSFQQVCSERVNLHAKTSKTRYANIGRTRHSFWVMEDIKEVFKVTASCIKRLYDTSQHRVSPKMENTNRRFNYFTNRIRILQIVFNRYERRLLIFSNSNVR